VDPPVARVADRVQRRPAGRDVIGLVQRAVIREQCERSLDRLGCDRLDLYFAHLDDTGTDQAETLGAFAALVGEGTVDVLGASNLTTGRLREARDLSARHGWPGYQVVQLRHSFLAPLPDVDFSPQRAIDDELLAYAGAESGLSLQGYSPLLGGAYGRPDKSLAPEYQGEHTARRLAVLHETSAALGITANQLVLAWMLAGSQPVVPVLGVSSPAQLDEAMDALAVQLDPDVVKALDLA
jgi:aryl-alcohol dehydrogenase-like predicted oxidoreductase